jgi:hypothetical protein
MRDTSTLAGLEGIPAASRPLWIRLVDEELMPVHDLFRQVREYHTAISQRATWRAAGHGGGEIDPTLARALVEASQRLLGTLTEQTPTRTRRLVQAAVRYFLIEDDADADLDSILGLDDDADVINAVLRHLGYEDWQVPVP